jgi:predicted amidohydrolase YtcJ
MRLYATLLSGWFSFAALLSLAQTPSVIFINAKVFTSDSKHLYAEAVAVSGNKILAVGSTNEISRMRSANTKVINLKGHTMVPGFNDSHYHTQPYYPGYVIADKPGGAEYSWQELKDSIAAADLAQKNEQFIIATMGVAIGTDTTITRRQLDQLAPHHPLFIHSNWGHVVFFNTEAMKKLGLTETEPDAPGGRFGRYPGTNILNGQGFEYESNLLHFKLPYHAPLLAAALNDLGKEALSFGITTIQNMCTGGSPAQFLEVLKKHPLPIRFRLIRWALLNAGDHLSIPELQTEGAVKGLPLVTVSGTKWLLDGTPIERDAWMRTAYKDDPATKGKMNFTPKEFSMILSELKTRNDQPLFHVVGDATMEYVLKELMKDPAAWQNKRVRLEHADGLMPQWYSEAKKLHVIVVQNPIHFSIGNLLNMRHGAEMLANEMPLKSLLKAGIPLALGSDGPLNPFLNIMFACTDPFRPSEALTREEAVIAYTKTSAYAEGEDNKGMIARGQLADMTVLSEDIFTIPVEQLPAVKSVLTMVNGKVVYNNLKIW